MIYKYSQIDKRISYGESSKIIARMKEEDKPLHWGQLKLFLSELLYLSMFNDRSYIILYVGAAEGTHISKLAEMFSQHKFILYDPRKFVLKKLSNIELHNKLFTDEEASKYIGQGKNILFISDIRILAYGESKKNYSSESDELVFDDMKYQMDWVKKIKPHRALLKFRTLYTQNKFEYFDGPIYLQQYSPPSTETRLLVKNYKKMKLYDAKEFDEKMAYYNCCIRPKKKSVRWKKVMDKLNLKNTLDMENMLYILEYYLIKAKGMERNKSDNEVINLFKDVGGFFKKMNGQKYNKLLKIDRPVTIKI